MERLFLPKIVGGELDVAAGPRLELRQGFVFWRNLDRSAHPEAEQAATDAEVYFTIASVLHGLRQAKPGGRRLVQHEHNRTVLDPLNFVRFNDGIIQAALLRAALPPELDYTDDERLSGEMTDILRRFAKRRKDREGEAFPEFLLALAQERMRLTRRDSLALANEIDELELPPLTAVFSRMFSESLGH